MTSNATEEPLPPPPMPTEAAAERASCPAAVGCHISAACTGVMRSSRWGSGYSLQAAGPQRNVQQATASLLTPEPTCNLQRRLSIAVGQYHGDHPYSNNGAKPRCVQAVACKGCLGSSRKPGPMRSPPAISGGGPDKWATRGAARCIALRIPC